MVNSQQNPVLPLTREQPFGKRTVLVYDAEASARPQSSTVTILKLEGDDMDEQPVCVTIAPLLMIPLPFNLENVENFPGLPPPTVWPPFDVIIEWGVGGSSARMSVDVVNGAVVPNLAASWICVHAVVPAGGTGGEIWEASGTRLVSPSTETRAAYVVSAFVGPGPAIGAASKTVWVGPLDAGAESDAMPVPRFARNVAVTNVTGRAAVPTAATLRLWQDRARTQPVANFTITGAQSLPFEVPNGAMYASVVNDMAVAARFGIVYSLCCGV